MKGRDRNAFESVIPTAWEQKQRHEGQRRQVKEKCITIEDRLLSVTLLTLVISRSRTRTGEASISPLIESHGKERHRMRCITQQHFSLSSLLFGSRIICPSELGPGFCSEPNQDKQLAMATRRVRSDQTSAEKDAHAPADGPSDIRPAVESYVHILIYFYLLPYS